MFDPGTLSVHICSGGSRGCYLGRTARAVTPRLAPFKKGVGPALPLDLMLVSVQPAYSVILATDPWHSARVRFIALASRGFVLISVAESEVEVRHFVAG